MKGRTRVNHPPDAPVPADNRPLVAPIHQTVKFAFESLDETMRAYRGEREGYYYTRQSNPTTRQLEKLLAELQGRDDCVAVGSGVAAVADCLLSLTRAGQHVLCFVETYTPSRQLIQGLLSRFGVEHTMLSIEDDAGIERVLAEKPTRLVWFESPTNPVTRIADIGRITRAAHAHGALTVLDNTFAGFHNHGQYGVDVFVHSLTKYASGHGDVMGGAIIARDELIRGIRRDAVVLGALLDPHAAFLVMRGMKTYYLRYDAQAASAARIAAFLDDHPAVARVHYPGLRQPPAPRARARADARFRLDRLLRPRGRPRGGARVLGCAGILRDRAEPGFGRIAGDALATAAGARALRRAGRDQRDRRRHGAPLDRHRGHRRPDRGSRRRALEGLGSLVAARDPHAVPVIGQHLDDRAGLQPLLQRAPPAGLEDLAVLLEEHLPRAVPRSRGNSGKSPERRRCPPT